MKSVIVLICAFFLGVSELQAFYSEDRVMERLDDHFIPDHYVKTVERNVNVYGTFYDQLIVFKDRRGQIIARKGYVTQGTGEYEQIIFYQNGIGRNLYRVGLMSNKEKFGTQYDRLVFFQNHIGKNLAILSTSGEYTFYQNGIFRNISALNKDNFLDGSLRPISRDQFRDLFEEFLGHLFNY